MYVVILLPEHTKKSLRYVGFRSFIHVFHFISNCRLRTSFHAGRRRFMQAGVHTPACDCGGTPAGCIKFWKTNKTRIPGHSPGILRINDDDVFLFRKQGWLLNIFEKTYGTTSVFCVISYINSDGITWITIFKPETICMCTAIVG